MEWIETGMALHSRLAARGFDKDVFVASALVDMYAKCGSMADAVRVFSRMVYRDVVSWNSVLFGYVDCGEPEAAVEVFSQMISQGVQPDSVTYVAVLKACARIGRSDLIERGMALHSRASMSGFDRNLMVASTLIDMYASFGALEDARRVFDKIEHRDVVAWNSVIFGHAENGEPDLALEFFFRMLRDGNSTKPNAVTFVAVLKACSTLAMLETGRVVHSRVCSSGLENDAKVANALVDFYGKCGKMIHSRLVFDSANTKNLATWNVLIAGYTKQGETGLALALLERMFDEKLLLDNFTLLYVLKLCSHAGMVSLGKKFFDAMDVEHSVVPDLQHYTCMVDLLCRANRIDEALRLVQGMRVEPDAAVWRTILSASHKWKNAEAGRTAFESVMKLEDKDSSAYVLMSNVLSADKLSQLSKCGELTWRL